MSNKFEQINAITFDTYSPPEYLSDTEKNRFNDSVVRLREIHTLLATAVSIASTTSIPARIKIELEGIIEDYLKIKSDLDDSKSYKPDYNFNNVSNRITSFHNEFFESRSSNSKMLLINLISNYQNITSIEQRKRLDDINSQLTEKNKRVDEILRKLESPSAERVLADYANEYNTAETKNNDISRKWLRVGIISTLVFIFLIICSILFEWFPTKIKLETVNNFSTSSQSTTIHEIINIPVLATKILLVSIVIFLLVFCFKQYSIHKHLATVNQHRKNAFNSYVLFAAAIGEKDTEAKKAILMSLAKTIHESITTGFLTSKLSDHPIIQNLELGKAMPTTVN